MSDSCVGADDEGLICVGGWLYTPVGGMIFPANKKCPRCNPRAEDAIRYGQVWIRSVEPRAFYTDEEGVDFDIVDMRDALIAIKANTAPDAISLSPENRIKAIYEICCKALPLIP